MVDFVHFCSLNYKYKNSFVAQNHDLVVHCFFLCVFFLRTASVKLFPASLAELGTLKRHSIWLVSMNRTPCIVTPRPPSVTLHQSVKFCS